jgi:two-component system, chemotaxis family, protein-glutamate methylesterase/glutaminase
MAGKRRDVVVIGASSGGLEALDDLVRQLPADFPASIFIVQHLAPENTGAALLSRLGKSKVFRCKMGEDGEHFKPGGIYIAPPDHHMLIKDSRLLVSKGARENRYRPAIDPLFRSAAVAHGPSVVGVILSGLLDDGTAGLGAIKRCGGVAVVQDPKDAAYPDMPRSAIENVDIDHCVPVGDMGPLLEKLARGLHGGRKSVPEDVRIEAVIAERVLSDVGQVNGLGDQVPYNCPNCGGVLWEMTQPQAKRYRCHTGHSFTSTALLASQSEKIEETLWVSLRMFEERKNLLNNMARDASSTGRKKSYIDTIKETQIHIERIRDILRGRPRRGAN